MNVVGDARISRDVSIGDVDRRLHLPVNVNAIDDDAISMIDVDFDVQDRNPTRRDRADVDDDENFDATVSRASSI